MTRVFLSLCPQFRHGLENKGQDLKEEGNVGDGRQLEEYLNDGVFWKKEGSSCLLLKSNSFVSRENVHYVS